jgi:hypothetical protein
VRVPGRHEANQQQGEQEMKVKIEYTVEVDQAKWADFYGVELCDVREDVKSYFTNWVAASGVIQVGLVS